MLRQLSVLCLTYLVASPVLGSDVCKPDDRWPTCFNRLLNELSGPLDTTTQEAQTTKKVNDRTQQAQQSTNATDNGTLRDLLPQIFTALGIDGLDDSNGSLKYSYNFEPESFGQFSVEATALQPKLFSRLEMAIPEAEREANASKLGKELGDFDDLQVTLSLSMFRTSGRTWWGRRLLDVEKNGTALSDLAGHLFKDVTARVQSEIDVTNARFSNGPDSIQALIGELQTKTTKAHNADNSLPTWQTLTVEKTDEPTRRKLQAAFQEWIDLYDHEIKKMDTILEQSRYRSFGELVARQPQLLVTAKRQFRDELTGANEWSISLRGEGSWTNLNSFRKKCFTSTEPDVFTLSNPTKYSDSLGCFEDYIRNNEANMKKGWRWSLEADYSRTDEYAFMQPDLGIDLQIDEVQTWTAKAALGRAIRLDDKGLEISRFDLLATYDDVTGDPEKQSRFLLTATLTQRLSDDMSLETSIVYANKPEYRGEVDEEFSARAGFKYKINRNNDS